MHLSNSIIKTECNVFHWFFSAILLITCNLSVSYIYKRINWFTKHFIWDSRETGPVLLPYQWKLARYVLVWPFPWYASFFFSEGYNNCICLNLNKLKDKIPTYSTRLCNTLFQESSNFLRWGPVHCPPDCRGAELLPSSPSHYCYCPPMTTQKGMQL